MSIVAIVPAANIVAVNNALGVAGFGYSNFQIAAYTGVQPTHAVLHCWPNAAFQAALEAIPQVTVTTVTTNSVQDTAALANTAGATFGGNAPPLPNSGTIVAGSLYSDEVRLWRVLQTHDRTTFGGDPAQYPALIREARVPTIVSPWKQPIDQFDAYKVINPFTGLPDRVTHLGQTWQVTQGDGSGNNVFEPGVFGWAVV